MRTFITQQEYTNRLNHYNRWLMDNKKDFCMLYPGFPADVKQSKKTKSVPVNVEAVKNEPTSKKEPGRSKIDRAREIFKQNLKQPRDKLVAMFMKQLDMTKASATSYYYVCKK